MAIKPFNSVGGYSVGPNLVPFLDASNNANVANLTVNGTLGLTGNVSVGNIAVTGQSNLNTLNVANAAVFSSTANVANILTVTGNIDANGQLVDVAGNLVVGGTANVTGILSVTANIDGGANLNLTGNAVVGGTLGVTGAANLASTLGVAGKTTLDELEVGDAAIFNSSLTVSGTGSFTANGVSTFNDDVQINTAAVTLSDTSLTSNGTVSFTGSNVSLGAVGNVKVTGGTTGQVLSTDGAGNLSFITVSSGSISNGTSNLSIPVADGPITMGVNGTANVAVIGETSANFAGNVAVGNNLSTVGIANIGGALNATGAANLDSTLRVGNATTILGAANIANTLLVTGAANIDNTLRVGGNITGTANLLLTGYANVGGVLNVTGATDINSTLDVQGNIDGGANLNIVGIADVGSLDVAGNAAVGNVLTVTGFANVTANINGGAGLNLTGTANVNDLSARGNANVAGTANVVGAANLGSTLGVAGIATFASNVGITGDRLSFIGAVGATANLTTSLGVAELTANGLVTLGNVGNVKIAGGTSGQILVTDGAGNLSFSSAGAVTSIANGTSNVNIATADGNVTIGVNGQANIITVQSNGTFATTTITNDAIITGNLTVQGDTVTINTSSLNIEDPIITEGRGPNNTPLTTNDGLDRGLYSYYYDGAERGAFIGYKNAGAFAGDIIIAKNATITDNVVGVTTYANVVVAGIVSGPAGNTAGTPVSSIDMGTGSAIAFRVNNEAATLNVTASNITANANMDVNGGVNVTNGNITVAGGTSGGFGSQISLSAAPDSGGTTAVTTLGAATALTNSSTPVAIVSIPDAEGRTVEFFISARDTTNNNFEGAKYLVVSNGVNTVDFTTYGTVRIGAQTQQVEVSFTTNGTILTASVRVLDGNSITRFTTQYQIVG